MCLLVILLCLQRFLWHVWWLVPYLEIPETIYLIWVYVLVYLTYCNTNPWILQCRNSAGFDFITLDLIFFFLVKEFSKVSVFESCTSFRISAFWNTPEMLLGSFKKWQERESSLPRASFFFSCRWIGGVIFFPGIKLVEKDIHTESFITCLNCLAISECITVNHFSIWWLF